MLPCETQLSISVIFLVKAVSSTRQRMAVWVDMLGAPIRIRLNVGDGMAVNVSTHPYEIWKGRELGATTGLLS